MGQLWSIIQEHIDAAQYPPSQRKIAQRLGVAPTTLSNWRLHLKDLPTADNLRAISDLTETPYLRVLDAALIDAGYLDDPHAKPSSAPLRAVEDAPMGGLPLDEHGMPDETKLAARRGVKDNLPDTTTGEESQDNGDWDGA